MPGKTASKFIAIILCCCFFVFSFAQHGNADVSFSKPRAFSFITNVPKSFTGLVSSPFKKKNILSTAIVAGSTLILITNDKAIYNGIRNFSDNIHLQQKEENNVWWSIKNGSKETVLFKIPRNFNTAFYMMGHWFPSIALAGGLWVHGKIKHNCRSLQTASDIVEGYITQSIATQIVKRISGRESPLAANGTAKWRPFVSFSDYKNNRERYDAFSSGHIATMMTTITILADNYPEKKWIKPVGYSLVALCGFSMINNGVHWSGDFPLGIAIGYVTGKVISNRHKSVKQTTDISLAN